MLRADKSPKDGAPGGQGTCALAGPCDFLITITNTGGSTYVGQPIIDDNVTPAVVADMHGTGTPDASIWTCKTVSNGTAGGCISNGAITLAPNQSTSICATMTAASGTPSQSCATVAITPSTGTGGTNGIESQEPQTPPVTTPANPALSSPACFSNMVPDGNGGCVRPPNTSWDGKQCSSGEGGTNGIEQQPDTTPICPIGTIGTYPNCQPIPIQPKAASPPHDDLRLSGGDDWHLSRLPYSAAGAEMSDRYGGESADLQLPDGHAPVVLRPLMRRRSADHDAAWLPSRCKRPLSGMPLSTERALFPHDQHLPPIQPPYSPGTANFPMGEFPSAETFRWAAATSRWASRASTTARTSRRAAGMATCSRTRPARAHAPPARYTHPRCAGACPAGVERYRRHRRRLQCRRPPTLPQISAAARAAAPGAGRSYIDGNGAGMLTR